jgi:MSHA pilin protein MshD
MSRQQGFSLIETVIFIVVVGIALSGLVSLFVHNTTSSADPMIRERAVSIAHAYMDEILAKGFDENTPLGGGCVESGSDSCTEYCAAYSDAQCVQSKCRLQAAGECVPRNDLSGIATEEGSHRAAYDDVDDYHGIDETPSGIAVAATDYEGFNVKVSVSQPDASWHDIDAQDLRLIKVEVTSPLGETVSLQAYRVNF